MGQFETKIETLTYIHTLYLSGTMAEQDAFEQLDKTKSSGGGGDFADWWKPSEGDKLVGVVVEKHYYTDPGGNDHPVSTVRSVGQGDVPEGSEVATPTHTTLTDTIEQVDIGDVVLIEYEGVVKADSGFDMNMYATSVLKYDSWQETQQADMFQDTLESSQYYNGSRAPSGDSGNEQSGGIPEKALTFAADAVEMNGGELPLDEFDDYLNDVRDYGVDPEQVIDEVDSLTLDGETVKKD